MDSKKENIKEYLDKKIDEYDNVLKAFYEKNDIAEEALRRAFKEPNYSEWEDDYENSTNPDILSRVILINQLYSTGLQQNPTSEEQRSKRKNKKTKDTIDVFEMAHRISDNAKELDELLEEGNPRAVEIIRDKNSELYNDAYSFATKYCSFYNPDAFPIVDDIVKKMLKGFLKGVDRRYIDARTIRMGDLDKDYEVFKKVHLAFQKYVAEKANSRFVSCKYIDVFLWECGKEYMNV